MLTRRFFLSSSAASSVLVTHTSLARAQRAKRKAPASPPPAAPLALDTTPANSPLGPVPTPARWACVLDFNTGATLLEKAANERMPPSSLTKLMTTYLVFAMLSSGRLSLTQRLPVSEKAWRMQGSKMFVSVGQTVPVVDLIQGMVVQSGNDACIVLAEGIAGSEERFVEMMNAEAPRLGLQNSHFMNATGWPHEAHYMSARDVCLIAYHLIRDYPNFYHFFSEKQFTYNKITQGNRNTLVDSGIADGLKTGHTDAGGFGLCASAIRGGNRIIATVNGLPTIRSRSQEGERLVEWSFANFENVTLFRQGDVVARIPVWMGETANVALTPQQNLTLTLPHNWRQSGQVQLVYPSPAVAPISVGQHLGNLVFRRPGMADLTIPLVAENNVPRLTMMGRVSRRLGF